MSKKLLTLMGGTLISGMMLVGCGVNNNDQNPPPENVDVHEDVNDRDRVEDDIERDLDMNNNDNTLNNNRTNGMNGTNGTTGNGMNGTTGNGTGTNGNADLLNENKKNTGK